MLHINIQQFCFNWQTKKRKLPGGIVVEDLKKGEGQAAKKGQTVTALR